ncbi:transcriptional repressor LexA [Clostridia bacterium]|nr:transcriptional repressor LexA [Clostridia bacterium]
MTDLTKRQEQIYHMIKRYVSEKGYPPTVREIAKAVGLHSISTVHTHLKNMEALGYIRRNHAMSRAIELVEMDDSISVAPELLADVQMVNVPLLGRVTAGIPIEAIENIQETYPLPLSLIGSRDAYILEVVGESMIEAGINDGDLAIIEKKNTANNGEIVVAMLPDNEATIKRFYRENKRFRLQPENHTMEPIFADKVDILGKVIGIYRNIS